jgi:hypothetical protein
MTKLFKSAALAAATAGLLAGTVPATAANLPTAAHAAPYAMQYGDGGDNWQHGRRDDWNRGDRYRDRYSDRGYYNERARYEGSRSWRGRDGRTYCRRDDGTTGLLIGGAVGGLIGNGIAGRGDNTLGTILGVAGGALLGREIDRGGSRCR